MKISTTINPIEAFACKQTSDPCEMKNSLGSHRESDRLTES